MAKDSDKNTTAAVVESEGWRPEEGDVLSGTVARVSKAWSDYTDSFYPLLTIEHDGQLTDVHCFHEILKNRMLELRPVIGDELTITYLGKSGTKDGRRSYARYIVDKPGETGAEVWADLGAQPRRAADSAAVSDVPPDTEGLPNAQARLGDDDIPF